MIIRDAKPEDVPWLMNTWLDTYEKHTRDRVAQRCLSAHDFYPRWRVLVQRLLEVSRVSVATHAADPDVICGWLCWLPGSPPKVHYVHVRRSMRKLGVARALLDSARIDRTAPVMYSHRTEDSDALVPDAWLYRPWMLIGV